MRLKGSCDCGAVKFECNSKHPYPYQLCYCTHCRKQAGCAGYGINLAGDAESLEVSGTEFVSTYQVKIQQSQDLPSKLSELGRRFCKNCGSSLWADDPRWPELVHPFASAIDTPLPVPPERTHIFVGSKASWVQPSIGPHDKVFDNYPDESIAQWHQRHELEM